MHEENVPLIKSSIIRLTLQEIEDFKNGVKVPKLVDWNLSLDEFNNMLNSGQIVIGE